VCLLVLLRADQTILIVCIHAAGPLLFIKIKEAEVTIASMILKQKRLFLLMEQERRREETARSNVGMVMLNMNDPKKP